MDTLVDSLNRILTNTLEYREALEELADSVNDRTTASKLDEFAEVRGNETENLMELISGAGGRIESSGRTTDQESVSWLAPTLPDAKDMAAVLSYLIKAEQKAKDDYATVLDNEKLDEKGRQILEKHRQEASSNLQYFESAKASIKGK
ncbi:MAG: hypothetical protein WA913_00540 [Pricia sp.]